MILRRWLRKVVLVECESVRGVEDEIEAVGQFLVAGQVPREAVNEDVDEIPNWL